MQIFVWHEFAPPSSVDVDPELLPPSPASGSVKGGSMNPLLLPPPALPLLEPLGGGVDPSSPEAASSPVGEVPPPSSPGAHVVQPPPLPL
jgi:hypothetical protein